MARDGFVFYRSFYEALKDMDDETRLRVYDAVCSYALMGEDQEVSGIAGALFCLMRPQIDANNTRYENGKKGGEYGKSGGRPRRAASPEQTSEIPNKNPNGVSAQNPEKTPMGFQAKTPKEKEKKKEKEKEKDNIPPIIPPKGEIERLFEIFWTEYPKKRSKGDALKAFKSLKPSSELVATMCEALARAKTCYDWQKDGGQYIPYPATWLRARGWEDDYSETQQQRRSLRPFPPDKPKFDYTQREYSEEDYADIFENSMI